MGIALRQRADAPYMRRFQYLLRLRQLSIEEEGRYWLNLSIEWALREQFEKADH